VGGCEASVGKIEDFPSIYYVRIRIILSDLKIDIKDLKSRCPYE
jgi:hypothetical protein